MRSTLIVARMKPTAAADVKQIFAESDAGELPHLIGVKERRLFRFHDLYLHYIASDEDVRGSIGELKGHELFTDVSDKLSPYIAAYEPQTWRGPQDAMAREFYTWRAED
ncbi:TcmI family type II polyketide cyclase [Streptomyces sp. SID13666]|uniref:TcmI family type II polyketide cyclase n=1 Tax=unclassified Streptomyces TaxID=2593676 RepID=UPI0013BF35C6|nr:MULTISPECIES: TcmI family type II polyketide cyclase [unclassified Streptomyces]NEA55120.1 TcmI family type II polyketide cyclase [Streptomyces sp. SID13666]NEA71127.1 TcmI family type II polyketide cyclase [Streptomyces sp. SID13588]